MNVEEQTEKAVIHLQWLLECGCEFEYSATKTAILYGIDKTELVNLYDQTSIPLPKA
jgi:hypothetical protein